MTNLEHVSQFSTFYALRPELLDNDEQRAAFAAQYPELVEKFKDCWQPEEEEEEAA